MPGDLPATHAVFSAAIRHHRNGRLQEAEPLYRQVLAADPGHADSLHLLGVIASQTGRPADGVAMIRAAIAIDAGIALYHANLGLALLELGRPDEAIACYRTARDLKPDEPERHYTLGAVLQQQGRREEAAACYRQAIDRKPDYLAALNNLGLALQELGQLDEAAACYLKVLARKPDDVGAHYNLGITRQLQEQPDAAIACYRRALDLQPDLMSAFYNLGNTLRSQKRLDEAAACFRQALAVKPDDAGAHSNLAMVLLEQGDLAAGWEEYEWRWRTPPMTGKHRGFAQPQWRGEAAPGKTLLIHAEQGFGDTLQFCRYAALAAASGLRIVLEVQPPLVRLCRSLHGLARVVANGESLPAFDLQCPMLSLPLALGTTLATLPTAIPYLQADPAQVAAWRTRLAAPANRDMRIGLVWSGDPRIDAGTMTTINRQRSLTARHLAPLFDIPGLQVFSLQKLAPAAPKDLPLIDYMAEMDDFADTAALIANLDLVLSVDTAVAHLAAALGKPVWVLGRFDSCWRWLIGSHHSPWYPNARLYRQPAPGDWDAVLADSVRDLRTLVADGVRI